MDTLTQQQAKRLSPLQVLKEADELMLHEIYSSIQGESSFAGRPCTFIRTTACHLRCTYCDTPHAFHEGTPWTHESVMREVRRLGYPLVELTGGEPLLQAATLPLMKQLADEKFEVLLETSGSLDISAVDPRVVRIVDFKAPSSGEEGANAYANVEHLTRRDEVKLVLANKEDYAWAKSLLQEYDLSESCTVLVGPVFGKLEAARLAQWVMDDHLPVRVQIQLHKVLWDPKARGV